MEEAQRLLAEAGYPGGKGIPTARILVPSYLAPEMISMFVVIGTMLEENLGIKFKIDNPIFAHFTKDMSLTPEEYFQRNCFIGASFLAPHEIGSRYDIGVDKLMWGSDYPHMEGTWPDTMNKLRETFHDVDEKEVRAILGETAIDVFGFDRALMEEAAARIGPDIGDIQQAPRDAA